MIPHGPAAVNAVSQAQLVFVYGPEQQKNDPSGHSPDGSFFAYSMLSQRAYFMFCS